MRMLVAGGGTAGHLYPGVAVAERWLARGEGWSVAFAGTPGGMEARLVPELGHPFFPVRAGGVVGKGLADRLRGLVRLLLGFADAGGVLRRFDPHVVLGVGGYVSVPVMLRAVLGRRATALQEQNAEPGLANRVLGRLVQRAFVSHAITVDSFPPGVAVLTGNPVRASLLADLERARAAAPAPAGTRRLLVFGGSQGARVLNEQVPGAVRRAAGALAGTRLEVAHQTGRGQADAVAARYRELGLEAEVGEFFHDMGRRYGEADLAVTRAGAGTVTELAAVGLPAILVPFPHAGGHQRANARALAERGAVLCLEQDDVTEASLGDAIAGIVGDDDARARMAAAALELARPDAAERIAETCAELAAAGRTRT